MINKIPSIVLYALIIISIVVLGLFYFGGSEAVGEYEAPFYTDTLIFWMYVQLGITIVITVCAGLWQFITQFKASPKDAVRTLLGVGLFIIVLAVSWALGDDTPLTIKGYEGTDNVPFWLKTTDMFIYSSYALTVIAIILIIAGSVKKRFS